MGLVGGALLVLLSIFRVGILARELELEDYGDVIIAINFFQIIALFLRPGISDLLYRFLSNEKEPATPEFRSSLIIFTLYLSGLSALIVLILILVVGAPLSQLFYESRPIFILLLAYLPVAVITQLNETAETVLRIKNKFQFVVFPPLVGAVSSLFWIWHAKASGFLDSHQAVLAIGAGQLASSLICLGSAAYFTRREFLLNRAVFLLKPLCGSGKAVKSCLFQTSLIRYLKASSDQGGIFMLGILGSSAQVAIFGMAYQLTRPLMLVLSSVGSAVGPEVHRLINDESWQKVAKICKIFFLAGIPLTVVSGLISWFLGPYLVDWFLKPEYKEAVTVFTILLVAYLTMISTMPFFPAAVALDELKWRNVIVGLRTVYLAFVMVFWPSAIAVASVFLAGSLTTRVFNDWGLYKKLRQGVERDSIITV